MPRDPFQGYDAWKTASPYDDEIDYIDEAEKWLKNRKYLEQEDPTTSGFAAAYWIIKGLLEYLDEPRDPDYGP